MDVIQRRLYHIATTAAWIEIICVFYMAQQPCRPKGRGLKLFVFFMIRDKKVFTEKRTPLRGPFFCVQININK